MYILTQTLLFDNEEIEILGDYLIAKVNSRFSLKLEFSLATKFYLSSI